jgi:hypothetical protein
MQRHHHTPPEKPPPLPLRTGRSPTNRGEVCVLELPSAASDAWPFQARPAQGMWE